jgi:hypothetical protein
VINCGTCCVELKRNEMGAMLPEFKGSHCKVLTLCGQLKSADKDLTDWIRKQKTLITSYEDARKKIFLRSMMGGKSGKHVHIDVAHPDWFQDEDAPKANQSLEAFQKRFEKVLGLEIAVKVVASFVVKASELPERGMVRSMAIETKTGDLTIKMTSGTYSLSGAPITGVRWWQVEDSDEFRIKIDAQRSVTIGENYLVDHFAWGEQLLRTFILGK